MIRLTQKVFTDLMIWMVGLGLLMGVIFPFFVLLMGIPGHLVLTPWFFAACMTAGLIVSALNIYLARSVVGRRLRLLAERMRHVAENLQEVAAGDLSRCKASEYLLTVDSDDEIGESARAFNHQVQALAYSLETESAVRTFAERYRRKLFGVASLLDALFAIWFWLQRRIVLNPLAQLRAKAVQIAGSSIQLGEEIAPVCGRELNELTQAFNLMSRNLRQQIDQQEKRIQERTAELLATNQQLQHEIAVRQCAEAALRNLSLTDDLTGLHNRRGFLLLAEQQLKLAHRMQRNVLAIFGDVDNLKAINDTRGHAAGDQALIEIAVLLKKTFRETDVVARLGGDEFIVLALDVQPQDAEGLLARVQHNLAMRNAQPDGSHMPTLSLGVAWYDPAVPCSLTDLLAQADRAMYHQKKTVPLATGNAEPLDRPL